MSRQPADQARTIITDATTLTTLIDHALTNLNNALAGWPTTTPGASPASTNGTSECPNPDCANSAPCPLHDPDGTVTLTATERHATTPDKARNDLEQLTTDITTAARHIARAAKIAHRWGLTSVTDTEVKKGLEERLNEIWCANCSAASIMTPRLQGRTTCKFCTDFRQTGTCGLPNPNNFNAPKELLDIHARRRLNSADVMRTMTAAYGPTWNRKNKGKKKAA